MGFFGDIERFLAELYAYRWPIVVAGLVVLAAVAAWGSRKGWHLAVWRRQRAVAVIGTPLLILAIVGGWYTVSPLFGRTQLEEANPLVSLTSMPGNIGAIDNSLIPDTPTVKLAPEPVDSTFQDPAAKSENSTDKDSIVAVRPMPMTDDSVTDDAMAEMEDTIVTLGVGEVVDSPLTEMTPTDSVPDEATSPDSASPDMASPGANKTQAGMTSADTTPSEMTPSGSTPAGVEAVFTPSIVLSGEFRGTDEFHFARGQASLIETSLAQHVLRFEDFSVRNGPGLYVYLSAKADRYTGDSLELGKLKATDGSFNYEIPAGTDISQFKSVAIWCKPFGVLFGVAPLIAQ